MTIYEEARDDLIYWAKLEATNKLRTHKKFKTCRGKDGKPYQYCFWTEFFHTAMDRMAREKGLVS